MLNLSKNLTNGKLVSKRGDKYILCSSKAKIAGVFQEANSQTILTNSGKVTVERPMGIVIGGIVDIKVGEDVVPDKIIPPSLPKQYEWKNYKVGEA